MFFFSGKLGVKGVEVEGEVLNAQELERKLLRCSDIDDTTVVGLGDTDVRFSQYFIEKSGMLMDKTMTDKLM